MRDSDGRPYHDIKVAEGKTRNEAVRCLKNDDSPLTSGG